MKFLLALLFTSVSVLAADFDDNALKKALADAKGKKENLIFYTWSPHMVLSQKGLSEILQKSDWTKSVKVIVLIDPNANMDLAKAISEENKWPASVLTPVSAQALLKKGVRTHYPSYVFAKDGELSAPLVPGYKNLVEIESFARRYL